MRPIACSQIRNYSNKPHNDNLINTRCYPLIIFALFPTPPLKYFLMKLTLIIFFIQKWIMKFTIELIEIDVDYFYREIKDKWWILIIDRVAWKWLWMTWNNMRPIIYYPLPQIYWPFDDDIITNKWQINCVKTICNNTFLNRHFHHFQSNILYIYITYYTNLNRFHSII